MLCELVLQLALPIHDGFGEIEKISNFTRLHTVKKISRNRIQVFTEDHLTKDSWSLLKKPLMFHL